jgi:hypothetical protein
MLLAAVSRVGLKPLFLKAVAAIDFCILNLAESMVRAKPPGIRVLGTPSSGACGRLHTTSVFIPAWAAAQRRHRSSQKFKKYISLIINNLLPVHPKSLPRPVLSSSRK